MNLVWWVRGRGKSGIFLFNCVRQSYSDISEKVVEKRCYRFSIFVFNTIGYNGTRGGRWLTTRCYFVKSFPKTRGVFVVLFDQVLIVTGFAFAYLFVYKTAEFAIC